MGPRVILAEPRGFCAGVEMAIKALTWMVRVFEPPVYCYHEIVHNAAVVEAFSRAGVIFVDDVESVPEGSPVMLSAHGSSPEVVEEAGGRAAVMVDAVCPLVTKVHHEVKRMARDGYDIIYVGHAGHDEAVGTIAEAPDAVTLVDPVDGLHEFAADPDDRVALVAQTTLGMYEWRGVLDEARDRFPELWTAGKSDLCYATTNRQSAVRRLAGLVDLVLVVGSENSSNTQALVRVASEAGVEARRIDGPADIDPGWGEAFATIGVTSGASAPDTTVEAVVAALAPVGEPETLRTVAEDEYFPLPPTLRVFVRTLQALVEGAYACRTPGHPGPMEEDRRWGATEALELLGV
ncbi:MAG: 4-hydroxy-3-methylbut-2-enyl diphosphate reductase [Acidimicrobiia bacterium]